MGGWVGGCPKSLIRHGFIGELAPHHAACIGAGVGYNEFIGGRFRFHGSGNPDLGNRMVFDNEGQPDILCRVKGGI